MVKTHETVRDMTDGQRSDIIATMVTAIPSLSFDQAQGIIGNKGPFVADIGEVFKRHAGKPATAPQPSIEFTIGNRTYELVPFIEKDELVAGNIVRERAKKLNARLGEEDGIFILHHQGEIPHEFAGRFCMVFADWISSDNWKSPWDPAFAVYLHWDSGSWKRTWDLLNEDYLYCVRHRLVRRRT